MNSLFTVGRAGHGAGSDGYGTVIYTYSDHLSAWDPPRNLLRADSTRPGILLVLHTSRVALTGKGLTEFKSGWRGRARGRGRSP